MATKEKKAQTNKKKTPTKHKTQANKKKEAIPSQKRKGKKKKQTENKIPTLMQEPLNWKGDQFCSIT